MPPEYDEPLLLNPDEELLCEGVEYLTDDDDLEGEYPDEPLLLLVCTEDPLLLDGEVVLLGLT